VGGSSALGGTSSGGTLAQAGAGLGGTSAQGGTTIAGTTGSGSGGASSGGTASGGASSGGSAGKSGSGGTPASGGKSGAGGTAAGGARAGGRAAAGASSGAGAAGGSGGGGTGRGTPTFPDPPSNVSAWIDESWAAQLGNNVKTRKDWLLDSIMLGKGQINLCVRWGATTAPTATVKAGMAGAVQKWFNDWFSQLSGYGCFPYPSVTTKVTGWAVKSGNTSWVSDLDSAIKIYTETDADGEPKCTDSCSFFNNWTHTFPNCPGGEASHYDYWLWLDDTISGGAAAVGGDWGLRMPVSNFVAAMNKSNLVIEHEIGHGFGFQDYYDWTGSTPNGGSLMIVGSTSSQSPTTADIWLLRRTWKEMKALRSW
jgi:hypothetical protein